MSTQTDTREGSGRRAALTVLDRTPSLSARVFDQLRDAVVSGELAPSAPIVIEQLAATLGVSRTPIRESLLALRQLGLIEETPGGLRVTPLDEDYIAQVYGVRSVLEGLIVEAIAPRISKEDLDTLRRHGLSHGAGAARRSRTAAAPTRQPSVYFHDFIRARSQLTFVNALFDSIRVHRERLISLEYAPLTEQHGLAEEEHEAILAALEKRNGAAARRLMQRHLDRIAHDIALLVAQPRNQ